MEDYQSFETVRLLMKPTTTEDADLILAVLSSPKFLKFVGDRGVKTLADAEIYIEQKMIPQLKRLGYSNNTIHRKEDGAKLGVCGLYDRKGLEGVDIGFALLPEYEGQGYAYESTNKLMTVAREDFGLSRIKGITIEENIASRRLLEKLGLKFIKKFRMEGDSEELMLYEWSKDNQTGQ